MDETDITTEDLFRKVSKSLSLTGFDKSRLLGPGPSDEKIVEMYLIPYAILCIYGILASGALGNVSTFPT